MLRRQKEEEEKEEEEEEEAGILLEAHICSELNLAGFTKSVKQLKEHNKLTDKNGVNKFKAHISSLLFALLGREWWGNQNRSRICASVSL